MKRFALLLTLALASCARSDDPIDVGLEGLGLSAVNPGTVIPGSTLVIEGDSFVQSEWGASRLRLRGQAGGGSVDVTVRAEFVDYDHMTALVTATFVEELGGDVDFSGDATMEVESLEDGELYVSAPLPLSLSFRRQLTPAPSMVQTGGLLFVNDAIAVEGDGFLLGGSEGSTVAIVDGCFTPDTGGPCDPVGPVEVPLVPETPFSRERATFQFVPAIAGIEPGSFSGDVTFENRPTEGTATSSSPATVGYDLITSEIFRIEPPIASLGQYVFVEGGGFVGGPSGGSTEIRLEGTFTLTGTTVGAPVRVKVPSSRIRVDAPASPPTKPPPSMKTYWPRLAAVGLIRKISEVIRS